MIRRIILIALAVGIALFLAIQLVPFGHQHVNPPVTGEPVWPDPAVHALAKDACFDCHSNETTWPWYSNIAPISWLVLNHVEEGRAYLNFSEWDRPQQGRGEISEVIGEGEMPPAYYRLLHRSANLSAAQTTQLAQGLAVLR